MSSYSKKDAVRILTVESREYKKQLDGRNLLVVFRDRSDNTVKFFETFFLPRNFQHLTGIEYCKNGNVIREPVRFYNDCLDGRINENNIQFRKDGTTPLKLESLPKIISFVSSSKMTGLYNGARPMLAVDRLAGTTNYCLGFTREGKYYAPSSCLLEDIRNLTNQPSQVLAILSKNSDEMIYSKIRYVAKGLPFDELVLPNEIETIVDRSGFVSKK